MAFGVYIHIPYCAKKCPYCDFNSYGVGSRFPEEDYTAGVLRELELYRGEIEGRSVRSIFFGGGTPSLFSPHNIEEIIDKICGIASPVDDIEISLEVNPKTADLDKLRGLLLAGVNRISVGVQSFSRRKLDFLGRINTPSDGRSVLKDVARAGFVNYNLDLMYGTGDETLDEWKADLEEAVGFGSNHISAYCLTIESGTEFGKLSQEGELILPGDEALSMLIGYTTDFLQDAGYPQYEISNYARPGSECRHNLLYWRGEDYLGLGAGAHSHLCREESAAWGRRWGNVRSPALYLRALREGKRPVDFSEDLTREEALQDDIMMGFRLSEGIDIPALYGKYGVAPGAERIESLRDDGFVELAGNSLRLTKKGTLLSDEIIVRLVSSLG